MHLISITIISVYLISSGIRTRRLEIPAIDKKSRRACLVLCLESHKAETKISTKLASSLKTLGEASTLKLVQVFGRNNLLGVVGLRSHFLHLGSLS